MPPTYVIKVMISFYDTDVDNPRFDFSCQSCFKRQGEEACSSRHRCTWQVWTAVTGAEVGGVRHYGWSPTAKTISDVDDTGSIYTFRSTLTEMITTDDEGSEDRGSDITLSQNPSFWKLEAVNLRHEPALDREVFETWKVTSQRRPSNELLPIYPPTQRIFQTGLGKGKSKIIVPYDDERNDIIQSWMAKKAPLGKSDHRNVEDLIVEYGDDDESVQRALDVWEFWMRQVHCA